MGCFLGREKQFINKCIIFMNPLKQKIIEKIKKEGPITFEKFMEMALYDTEYGYYTSKRTKIGREGDFYTSSHLHPVFGAMIGRQMEEMWEIMNKPERFMVVEMGAGEGYICKDMFDYFNGEIGKGQGERGERDILRHLQYAIVELNPAMQERQRNLLSSFAEKINWVSSLSGLRNVRGCIFSNELLDAFPVHLVQMEDELKEIYLSYDGEGLKEKPLSPYSGELSEYFKEYEINLEKGYKTEVNLRIKDWLNDIQSCLHEGFVITIDYGYPSWDYYSEERNRGTLLCYHKHHLFEDPYQNIGEQDITAHVNFSSVRKWGEALGFRTIGFCPQGTFFISLGIDEEIKRLAESSEDYLSELARIKKLILPGTIGETHKVMIQYKGNGNPSLKGFSIRNQIKSL